MGCMAASWPSRIPSGRPKAALPWPLRPCGVPLGKAWAGDAALQRTLCSRRRGLNGLQARNPSVSADCVEAHLAITLPQAQHLAPRHLVHLVDAEAAAVRGGPTGGVGRSRVLGVGDQRRGGRPRIRLGELRHQGGEGLKPLLGPGRSRTGTQGNQRCQGEFPAPARQPTWPTKPGPLAPGGTRPPCDRPGTRHHESSTA
jgi:hypothetical protein